MNKQSDNNKPLLSLIISCYNVSMYLSTMLDSLLSQKIVLSDSRVVEVGNCNLVEILLIEDCSSDNGKTLDICSKYEKQYSNVLLYKHKKNCGLSVARNTGINNAKGLYVSFPDPDDCLCEGIINNYIHSINSSHSDVYVYSLIERHRNKHDKVTLEKTIAITEGFFNNKKEIAIKTIELENKIVFGYAWNKLYKKEIIDKEGLKFQVGLKFIEDILFNIEFFKRCNSLTVTDKPAIIYERRLASGHSITTYYEPNFFKLHYERINQLYLYWKEFGALSNNAKVILSNLYFRFTLSTLWRNREKQACLSHKDRINWLEDFYNLELTKILLSYCNTNNKFLKIVFNNFKKKKIRSLLLDAFIIDVITKYFSGILIHIRQAR